MSNLSDAKKHLGQLLIMGFQGLDLSDETSAFLAQAEIGGVLLFAHNYEGPAQVAELCNQVQETRVGAPLWVSVDQEGGRVQRFRKSFTRIPDAESVAAMNSPKLAFEVAEVLAKEIKAVGINLNFAPVADIATNPKNPVIGNRAFGATEEMVSKISTAMVRGHLVHGVQPCVKHFPGHGDTTVDSHFALPRVDTPLEVLQKREFRPFTKAFKSHCSFVMSAHVIVSALDPDFPATLSPKVLHELLRKQMRYSRIIVSDDLEMKAITDHYGATEAPRLALQAGCDLLIYRSEEAARKAYSALLKDLDSGTLLPETVLESYQRIIEIKKDVLNHYQPANISEVGKLIGTPEHQKIMDKIEVKSSH